MLLLLEIQYYQKSDRCLIPLQTFGCLVREIIKNVVPGSELGFQSSAVATLQLGAEAYLVGLLEDSNLCAIHTKCITITLKDMHLAKRLHHDKVIGQDYELSAQLMGAKRRK